MILKYFLIIIIVSLGQNSFSQSYIGAQVYSTHTRYVNNSLEFSAESNSSLNLLLNLGIQTKLNNGYDRQIELSYLKARRFHVDDTKSIEVFYDKIVLGGSVLLKNDPESEFFIIGGSSYHLALLRTGSFLSYSSLNHGLGSYLGIGVDVKNISCSVGFKWSMDIWTQELNETYPILKFTDYGFFMKATSFIHFKERQE